MKAVEEILAGKDFNINGYLVKFGKENLDWVVITPDKRNLAKLTGITSEGKLTWERVEVEQFDEIEINDDASVIKFSALKESGAKYETIEDLKSKFLALKYYLDSKVYIKYVDLNAYICDDLSVQGTSTGGLSAIVFDIQTPYIPYQYILMHSRSNRDRDAYLFNVASDGKISGRYAYVSADMSEEDILKKLLITPDATLIDSYVANSLSHQSKNLQTFDNAEDDSIEAKDLAFISLGKFKEEAVQSLLEKLQKMLDVV